ncbi:MAG: hypothetical protein R3C15_15080 [Thermoleophilia bacterium]
MGQHTATVYVVDENDVLISVDGGWLAFASANGAPELARVVGRSLWELVTGLEVQYLWRQLLASARAREAPILVRYRCDAPDRRRLFDLELARAGDGQVRCSSVLVHEEERPPLPLLARHASRGDTILHLCSWCKRADAGGWVELEEAVHRLELLAADELPGLSHGICGDCDHAVRQVIAGETPELPAALRPGGWHASQGS